MRSALDPTMTRHQHLVWSYQLLGERNAVLAAAQDYVRRVNGDEAWATSGRPGAVGELDRARQTFEQAAQLFPHSALPAVTWPRSTHGNSSRRRGGRISPAARPGAARSASLRISPGGRWSRGPRRAAVAAFDRPLRQRAKPAIRSGAIALSAEPWSAFSTCGPGRRAPDRARRAGGRSRDMFGVVYPLLSARSMNTGESCAPVEPSARPIGEAFRKRTAATSPRRPSLGSWPPGHPTATSSSI